ncbi:hypothetical protein [Priestia megaterium]|uniref:hypothetical protein n=1 Tax=Priestia megaterium TaxID=1404 RepID=UPI002E1F4F91|nr:hypothetical protein [Priestia megaterium]
MHEKILIQGEPTLDILIDECPGEVGVICFQITVLPNRRDKESNESKDKREAKQEAPAPSEAQKNTEFTKQKEKQESASQPVAKEEKKEVETVQPEAKKMPVQEQKATPQKVIDFVRPTGHLDEPLTINKGSKILKDDYRRYGVAKTLKI